MKPKTRCAYKSQDGVLDAFPDKQADLETYIDSLPQEADIKKRKSLLINILRKAQAIFGYLPESVQLFVADKLKLQLADVYGVISFYSFFTTHPPGKYRINICMGTACFVKGADAILAEFESLLGIKQGETTDDRKFSLEALRCVGACSLAPVVSINDHVHAKVTVDMVQKIIRDCE